MMRLRSTKMPNSMLTLSESYLDLVDATNDDVVRAIAAVADGGCDDDDDDLMRSHFDSFYSPS